MIFANLYIQEKEALIQKQNAAKQKQLLQPEKDEKELQEYKEASTAIKTIARDNCSINSNQNKANGSIHGKEYKEEHTPQINVAKLLFERHRQYQQPMSQKIFPIDNDDKQMYCSVHKSKNCAHRKRTFNVLNNLCRYCLMEPMSESHKQNCWGIPMNIKDGKDEPDELLKNESTFMS